MYKIGLPSYKWVCKTISGTKIRQGIDKEFMASSRDEKWVSIFSSFSFPLNFYKVEWYTEKAMEMS